MKKQAKAGTTISPAEVVISGDPTQAMTIQITKLALPDRPPERPPIEPPDRPPVSPPEPPPSSSWSPPDYLRTDTNRVSIPNIPKPDYLLPLRDPVFSTRVIRITGDPGSSIPNIKGGRWGNETRHHYNSDQAWSWDQKLIYLDINNGGSPSNLFLDGETYEPLFTAQNMPSSSDVRWCPDRPEWMLAASGSKLLYWNPRTGEQETIETFSEFDDLTFGPWEGSPDQSGKRVVLTSADQSKAFVYDISTSYKYPTIDGSRFGKFADARISRAGSYVLVKVDPDEVYVTDADGREVLHLPNNYISHFDVTIDSAGDEVVVGRVNSSSVGQGPSGYISKYRLSDGRRTGLQSAKSWSSHTSARSLTNYCVAGGTLEGGDYIYNGELIMCDLDGGTTYRLCHTHTLSSVTYEQEMQPSHGPDGGRVIFASPWGSQSGVGCYVVDFRE